MLAARNDKAKCHGQSLEGTNVCDDRGRCGRFLRLAGDRQAWGNYWKAGDKCQSYEPVPVQFHRADDWDEDRIDVIGQNGNTGEHYAVEQ